MYKQDEVVADDNLMKVYIINHDANFTISVAEIAVEIGTNGQTITLPLMASAAGRIYTIYSVVGTDVTTIQKNGSDAANTVHYGATQGNDFTMNAPDEFSVLYCSGKNWYELAGSH